MFCCLRVCYKIRAFSITVIVTVFLSMLSNLIWSGLFHALIVQPSAEFELEALKESDVPAWHADLDGAFANELLFLTRMFTLPRKVLGSRMHCGNHRNQLLAVSVQSCVSAEVPASLLSMASFFRMASHWLRLVVVVPHVVVACSRVIWKSIHQGNRWMDECCRLSSAGPRSPRTS